MDEIPARDVVICCILALAIICAFVLAGMSDYQSELAYRQAWYESNGVEG